MGGRTEKLLDYRDTLCMREALNFRCIFQLVLNPRNLSLSTPHTRRILCMRYKKRVCLKLSRVCDRLLFTMFKISSPVKIEVRKTLDMRAGDTVRVWQKIVEKDAAKGKEKIRFQAFEGLVLCRKHGAEAGATFTVRKVIDGGGVEGIFPLYAPTLDKIEILKRAKVRRAKLYYVRKQAPKEIRRAMRHERIEKKDLQSTTDNQPPVTTEIKS